MKENGYPMPGTVLEFRSGLMEPNMKVECCFEMFLGYWKGNLAHGKGRFLHVDGDIYEGEWERDRANGYGVYTHTSGAQYEG